MDLNASIEIISIAPNRFSNRFLLSFTSKESNGTVNLTMMNVSGQPVLNELLQAVEGMNTYEFPDQQGLPVGICFIKLIHNTERITKKIILKS